jgi:hypothetical protein
MLVMNFLGYVEGAEARFVRAVEATLRGAFEHVEVFSSEASRGYANVIFVARQAPARVGWPGGPYQPRPSFLDGGPRETITDSWNPVATWGTAVERRWREESRKMLAGSH